MTNKENAKLVCWTMLFFLTVFSWLLYDIQSMKIDYVRHKYLIDSGTGERKKPYEFYNLNKIINQTQDYIESTNAIERLYDLSYNLNFENPFQIDQTYTRPEELRLSGWPVANQTKCGRQLDWILEQLNRTASDLPLRRGRLGLELTQLMDSFGKPEAGLYAGLVTWLGSYESCRQVRLNGNGGATTIRTRYCFARMRPVWWPKNESAATETIIRIGSCLPETCDTSSFAKYRSQLDQLIKFELSPFWRQGLTFESLFCLPDERSPIRRIPESGRVFMYLVSVWLATVLTGSIVYERIRTKKEKPKRPPAILTDDIQAMKTRNMMMMTMMMNTTNNMNTNGNNNNNNNNIVKWSPTSNSSMGAQMAQALSIRCSFKAFKTNRFRVRYGQGERVRVDLSSLDCVKVLMALGVVLGHSGYLWSLYTRSMSNRITNSTGGLGRMSLSLNRCVDTFFFFFGLLTTYTMMRKFSTRRLASPLTWLAVNAGIFLRITPLFMLIFWYNKSISPYTGSGPWWDYGVHRYSQRGVCLDDPWWRSVPYFGSSANLPAPACLLPGWFLVSYSKISLLMPLLTYILCMLPSHKWRLTITGIISSISVLQLAIKLALQTSIKLDHFANLGSFAADLMEKFESLGFMSTVGKLGAVAVGCLAGYLLKRYEERHIADWPAWFKSKLMVLLVSVLHLLVIFLPILGHELMTRTQPQHITTTTEFIVSNVVLVLLWPVLNAVLVINCCTTYNTHYLVRYAGHSFWNVFNKLSLCLYLIHWEVLFVGLTNFEQAPSHGFMTDVMKLWAFGVFYSLILALMLHILFEAPLAALTTLVFSSLLEASIGSKNDSSSSSSAGGGGGASSNSSTISMASSSNNSQTKPLESWMEQRAGKDETMTKIELPSPSASEQMYCLNDNETRRRSIIYDDENHIAIQ